MKWGKKDFLSVDALDEDDWQTLMDQTCQMTHYSRSCVPHAYPFEANFPGLKPPICYNVFFEPSTRTDISTRTAIENLGGRCVDVDITRSSKKKRESDEDTLATIDYTPWQLFAVRHPEPYSAVRFAKILRAPVINCGDGSNEHPTQTALDLFTIYNNLSKSLGDVRIVFVGDLKYGRTVHSLAKALGCFDGVQIYGASPEGLEMPGEYVDDSYVGHTFTDGVSGLRDILVGTGADVVYATRIQEERMPKDANPDEFSYVIDEDTRLALPSDSIIMHPLPRVDELQISRYSIDCAKTGARPIMFEQAHNGVPVRMAIMKTLLQEVYDTSQFQ